MRRPTRVLLSLSSLVALLGTALVIGARPADAAIAGVFKVDCAFVKHAPDDPIVAPGRPGASSDHAFLGSVGVDASSTFESTQSYASSCANNDRGTASRAAASTGPATAPPRPIRPSRRR